MSVRFATFSDLTRFTKSMSLSEQRLSKSLANSTSNKDTFLSHSLRDNELLPGIIKLLENHGASVYCDINDSRMPDTANPDTAKIVKDQISKSDRLVVFVTSNSRESKWIPWELGIGHEALGLQNVALLPAAKYWNDQEWARQEYLGLYRHIVYGELEDVTGSVWMVYDFRTNSAVQLSDWCRKASRSW